MKRSKSASKARTHRNAMAGRGVSITLQEAMRAHQHGHLEVAEPLYRKALQLQPGQPDALHYFGVLCHQRGRSDEAIELIGMALQCTPQHADAHNNLGNIHKQCENPAEAEECYRQALEFMPGHADALSNLAIVLDLQERTDEAFQAYTQFLDQWPKLSRAHYLMGMFLRDNPITRRDCERAVVCFREAFRLDPHNVRALEALGVVLYVLDQRDEAVEVYREWLEREPDDPIARHMLASCGGEVVPARAGDEYVRQLFDGFADSFDEQLLNKLDYRAPQAVAEALSRVLGEPAAALDILDAGCGTGLCGPLFKPYARSLVGVDLSSGMIGKARTRGSYDTLKVAELTDYLLNSPNAWDVVISADTLIYFGELEGVLAASHSALRSGGMLGFTLEVMDDDKCASELSPSGRYRHSRGYVQEALDRAGFVETTIETEVLRKEVGKPVLGWVVVARRK